MKRRERGLLDTQVGTQLMQQLETKDSCFPGPCSDVRPRAHLGQGKFVPHVGRKDNSLRNGWWHHLLPGWELRLPQDHQDPGNLPDWRTEGHDPHMAFATS